jgi:hypothetical protein
VVSHIEGITGAEDFQQQGLRRIFRFKMEEVTGGWRKLPKE